MLSARDALDRGLEGARVSAEAVSPHSFMPCPTTSRLPAPAHGLYPVTCTDIRYIQQSAVQTCSARAAARYAATLVVTETCITLLEIRTFDIFIYTLYIFLFSIYTLNPSRVLHGLARCLFLSNSAMSLAMATSSSVSLLLEQAPLL